MTGAREGKTPRTDHHCGGHWDGPTKTFRVGCNCDPIREPAPQQTTRERKTDTCVECGRECSFGAMRCRPCANRDNAQYRKLPGRARGYR